MDQQNQPPKPPFSQQPPPFNRQKRTGQTGRLPQMGAQQQAQPARPAAPAQGGARSLDNTDTVQVTGQAGPGRKEPPPVIPRKPEGGELFSSTAATITTLEDGAKIVRYAQPQKLSNLLQDAKSNIGGESSRFYGKGWVIGQRIAKIASDGMSVTYYPQDISELVRDLLGPDSETL